MEGEPLFAGTSGSARALAALHDSDEAGRAPRSKFIAGTTKIDGENELRILSHSEDDGAQVVVDQTFQTEDEIWSISSNPSNVNLLALATSRKGEHAAKVVRMQNGEDSDASGSVEKCTHFASNGAISNSKQVCFSSDGKSCGVVWDKSISVHDVETGGLTGSVHSKGVASSFCFLGGTGDELVASEGTAVRFHDLRERKGGRDKESSADCEASAVQGNEEAHKMRTRDVSVAGNKIATGGDDCIARVWDVRKADEPEREMEGHSHWVWQARLDSNAKLLVTCSSDALVCLWSVEVNDGSLGQGEERKRERGSTRPGRPIGWHEEHPDSVYSAAWSANDRFKYATLSYDGLVMVRKVPRRECSRLLL